MESSLEGLIRMKPHAVCIPFPAQGHINPMLNLAKLLHSKGFHITFVNTEFNQNRLLKSWGTTPDSLKGLHSFRFETIPDGLPPTPNTVDATQDIPSLCASTMKNCLAPFKTLLSKLNCSRGIPPVTAIVSDGGMSFTLDAAEELGIPNVIFWTTSACGFMGYVQYRRLMQKGYTPLKDASYLTNGYLDTEIDWIPGMKGIRLRDMPTFMRTTDREDIMLNFLLVEAERAQKATAIVLNTFDSLEQEVLNALSSMLLPPIYTIGPLQLLLSHVPVDNNLDSINTSLWKMELDCFEWLNSKDPNTVIYVNFGSITVMTSAQLVEFAWGLANSDKTFLWVIRPDLVSGENAVLPPEFKAVTRDRGLLASWCPQEHVLSHAAIGGFLTHSGWNSTIESISSGVPMICWPFFAEQQTNCRYSCREWGIGMEIESDVKRDEIERLVRELMEGEKGRVMRKRAEEWKKLAEEATSSNHVGQIGSSLLNFNKMVGRVLLSPRDD